MAYGIQVTGPAGNETINLSMLGGRSFVQEIVTDWVPPGGQTYEYTFPNIPSGNDLVIYPASAGPFYWETATVNGQAVLRLHANTPTGNVGSGSSQSILLVFARKTVESFNNDYGVALVNDAGERTVSAIYPTAEYLGKLDFNPIHDSWLQGGDAIISFSPYHLYTHTCTSTNIGAGRTRIILWSLPDTASDIWYSCSTSYIPSRYASSDYFQIDIQVVTSQGKGYAIPEAYVFAVDNISTSADSYGLRVYDASGKCTFDGGLNHMVINSYKSEMAYYVYDFYDRVANNIGGGTIIRPNPGGPANEYVIDSFTGITPLIALPTYIAEEGLPDASLYSLSSSIYTHTGMIRKSGNSLFLRSLITSVSLEDAQLSQGYYWEYGAWNNIGTVIVDGTPYGGTTLSTADLVVSGHFNAVISPSQTFDVSWTCSGAGATYLSWYLEDVYQSDLPLVGSGSIGPLASKTTIYNYTPPYNVVVVAKTASGKVVAQASFQFYVS